MRDKLPSTMSAPVPEYGLLLFDHLQAELSLKQEAFTDRQRQTVVALAAKRADMTLSWDDIYTCQLILVEYLNADAFKNKILALRDEYQPLAGESIFKSYLALRAADLSVTAATPIEHLRADYEYLLDRFYQGSASVSAREKLRTRLLRLATVFTVSFFLFGGILGIFSLTTTNVALISFISTLATILVVIFAGMTGAFLSIQQRLQSISVDGGSIYNLSLLTHGWFSIFISPLSGAVFAVVLYMFFAGGLLTGTLFPKINTLNASPPDIVIDVGGVQQVQKNVIGLTDFLPQTGPEKGTDFALLLIWSFVAGFAERLVPDALARLVSKGDAQEIAS